MGKKIMWVLLAIVVVLVILVWRVFANLDSIVEGIIEDAGSEALGTSVSVSGVSISLTEGKATIAGLDIANPPGFSGGNLFELESITVGLNIESLSQDVMIIDVVDIGQTNISYDLLADGSNNVQALMDNMPGGSSEETTEAGGPAMKLIIDSLKFDGASLAVNSEMEGVESQELNLPGINMSGIGRPNGATSGEIAKSVTSEVAGAVLAEAAKAGLQKALDEEKQGMTDKLMDKLKGD